MKDIVIFDTEYTSWEGSQARKWSEEWEHREVVQISAIRINHQSFEKLGDSLNILVKPRINSKLSEYFINLTSITNEDITLHGVDFLEAITAFRNFSDNAILYSFGNDCPLLNENIELYGLQNSVEKFSGKDIRDWATKQGIDTKKFTSGGFAEAVGAPFKTTAHYALNDVSSIHAAVKFLVHEKNYPNPFVEQ